MKEMPISERPREKFEKIGPENLSDKELLAIILKTGLKYKNVEEISMDLLNKYKLQDLKEISIPELTTIKGIGKIKAIELLASIELGKRIYLEKNDINLKLETPEKIWKDSKYLFSGKCQELFYCYYFNTKQELIARKLIFIGTVNSSITHTREIFKEAYKLSATSIVCLHNHPTNDVTPSKEDKRFTNNLIETGNIQGIPVIDHIIVGEDKYYSFYEREKLH